MRASRSALAAKPIQPRQTGPHQQERRRLRRCGRGVRTATTTAHHRRNLRCVVGWPRSRRNGRQRLHRLRRRDRCCRWRRGRDDRRFGAWRFRGPWRRRSDCDFRGNDARPTPGRTGSVPRRCIARRPLQAWTGPIRLPLACENRRSGHDQRKGGRGDTQMSCTAHRRLLRQDGCVPTARRLCTDGTVEVIGKNGPAVPYCGSAGSFAGRNRQSPPHSEEKPPAIGRRRFSTKGRYRTNVNGISASGSPRLKMRIGAVSAAIARASLSPSSDHTEPSEPPPNWFASAW